VHVFESLHWGVEITVFDIKHHALCSFCGDDAVHYDLDQGHLSGWCADILGTIDSTPPCCD
jgi:hypothetical protein